MKAVTLELTIDEANMLLEALGEMPYRRVYGLVSKIQQQASHQLADEETAEAAPAPEEQEEKV